MADNAPGTLLIPALLDHHWPLLRWAFETSRWHAEVLEDRRGVEDLGLRHVHGDLCYPFVLITGQVLAALRSGRYDPARTAVLISQAGDACRGSCLIRLLRPVLDREGFAQVRLLSLNVRGIEEQAALPVTVPMARRALAAVFWGDTLMLLDHQVRPYEVRSGETAALVRRWTESLSAGLREDRGLSPGAILRRCGKMAAETAAWVRAGYARVLGALPFGCLPGHIYGRGQYAALQRKLPGSQIVGVDYDAGLRDGTVESRIRMLLDMEP